MTVSEPKPYQVKQEVTRNRVREALGLHSHSVL